MNPNRKNLANAFLANPITDTATTMVYQTGYGSGKPAVPYFDTLTPAGQLSTAGNSEIVLVTALSGDTATIVRARKGTTAKPFSAGTIASNGIYVEDKVGSENIDWATFKCGLYRTANITVSGGWQPIPFDNEDYDTENMHSSVSNTDRINILKSGVYHVGGEARFSTQAPVGGLRVSRYNSSNTIIRGGVFTFGGTKDIQNVSGDVWLDMGDYIKLEVYTPGGTTVTADPSGGDAPANTRFWARLVP